MLLGESVGGPFWVFVAFGDVPSAWTLASGGLLIATLIGHEVAGMVARAAEEEELGHLDASKAQPLIDGGSRSSSLATMTQSPLLGAHSLCASPLLAVPSMELLHGGASGYVPPKA